MSGDETGRGNRDMKPIPNEAEIDLSAERAILPILPGNVQPHGFAFYAVVLPGVSATTLYQFIADRWQWLDKMTSGHTLLLVPVIPRTVTPEYLAWWQLRLTPSQFAAFQAKLLQGLEPEAYDDAAIQAYRIARDIGIPIGDLPAMIVTAQPQPQAGDSRNGVEDILIPLDRTWDESTYGKFFELFATACNEASGINDEHQRLIALSDDIDAALRACAPAPVAVRDARPLGIVLLTQSIGPLLTVILPLIVKAVLGH